VGGKEEAKVGLDGLDNHGMGKKRLFKQTLQTAFLRYFYRI
jgi:hypothetical protein